MREVEEALAELRAEHDPLAVHIFVARRQYRTVPDTKSGKRSRMAARISYERARELGFSGGFPEWERLLEAGLELTTRSG